MRKNDAPLMHANAQSVAESRTAMPTRKASFAFHFRNIIPNPVETRIHLPTEMV